MITNNDDRRVKRTKKLLRDALAVLIETKGLEKVSVCDITDAAEVNRGTFYAHYKDKNDLIEKSEDEILAAIDAMQKELHDVTIEELNEAYKTSTPLPFAVALYDYLRESGPLLRALIGPKGDPGFSLRMREAISFNVINNVLDEKYRTNMSSFTQYYLAYYTSAQLGILQAWLEGGMKESSEDMARIIVGIMFLRPGDAIQLQKKLAGIATGMDVE